MKTLSFRPCDRSISVQLCDRTHMLTALPLSAAFPLLIRGQILLSVSVILSERQNWAQISQNKIYRQHTSLNVVRKCKQWCVQHGKLRITHESWPLGLHRSTSSYVLLLPWIVWKVNGDMSSMQHVQRGKPQHHRMHCVCMQLWRCKSIVKFVWEWNPKHTEVLYLFIWQTGIHAPNLANKYITATSCKQQSQIITHY